MSLTQTEGEIQYMIDKKLVMPPVLDVSIR
jgi:hypothetical protein